MNLPYDVVKDFEPVSLIADTPHADRRQEDPAGERPEGTDRLAQGQPTRRRPASSASAAPAASLRHVVPEADRHAASSSCPIAAARRAMQDLVAGQIDIDVRPGGELSGRRCAPASSRPSRYSPSSAGAAAPDVPTMDEAGVPGLHASFWHGLWAPKGTPKDIIAKLNAAMVETLADPAVQQRFKDIGQETLAPRQTDAGGACRAAEDRDREMVADHQGRQHQGRVTLDGPATVYCARAGGGSGTLPCTPSAPRTTARILSGPCPLLRPLCASFIASINPSPWR